MATSQKQASVARSVFFRTKGSNYTAFLNTSHGNLIQQYDDEGNYYPEFTPTSPERLTFTATSSKSTGVVVPDSIVYKVAGVTLTFDTSGACTTPGASAYFRKDGADLLVIGNIAAYLGNASSMIEAIAMKGDDEIYAACQAEISQQTYGNRLKVSIAPGDSKNFTLTSQTDSVKLKAGVLRKSGWTYNSPALMYAWDIADPSQTSGWRWLKFGVGAAGGTLDVPASDVHSYANIRVTVYANSVTEAMIRSGQFPANSRIGSDCVGVLDASDPLDIIVNVKINRTGTGSEVDTDELALDDSMPANAYLIATPTLVVRGQTTSAGATTWLNGLLVDPAGVTTRNIIPSSGKYKLMVSDFSGVLGEHTIVISGNLT